MLQEPVNPLAWPALFARFKELKVLVVGDLMLDRFTWGKVSRISPEAPVPVVEVERESTQPGGAGNVVNNVVALGARACMVGVIGDDESGARLREQLAAAGVDVSGLVVDASRSTSQKHRIVAHAQQLVRVDRESRQPLSPPIRERLESYAARETTEVDAVVFSDYDKGVFNRELVEVVQGIAAERGIPVVANPKPANLLVYRGITAISLNQVEAERAVDRSLESEADVEMAGPVLLETLKTQHVIITLGSRGLAVFSQDGSFHRVRGIVVPVYDVAGAGDTVIGAFTLALRAGADAGAAGEIANLAGCAVVRKTGVATTTTEELLALHRENLDHDRPEATER